MSGLAGRIAARLDALEAGEVSAEVSYRWPTEASLETALAAKVIHARLSVSDEYALCERDGDLLPYGAVTLNFDDPGAATAERGVDCPACLEWMHA